jgi:tetratricopeptide (TPR) repeat protein
MVMRLLVRNVTLLVLLLAAASPAVAASSSEFYLSLLQRGIAAYDAGHYPEAATHLKLAAFGLLDSIENYETAQVYLTLIYERGGDTSKARDAARRVVAAERIQRRFGTLPLPAGVAGSFDTAAAKLLGSAEVAYLHLPSQSTPAPAPQPKGQPPATVPRPQQTATTAPIVPQTVPATTTNKPEPQMSGGTSNAPADPPKKSIETSVTKPVTKPVEKPVTKPAAKPAPVAASPAPQPAAPKVLSAQEAASRLAAAERALASAQLTDAKRLYRSLLDVPGAARDTLIRAAEGLYRARDFEGALAAFAKLAPLRRGEEPYHYYMAVAFYETGQYARAKAELTAAVPFIEITPDVARYRTKIDDSVD